MKVVRNPVEGVRFTIATMVCSVRRLYIGYFEEHHCYSSLLGFVGSKSTTAGTASGGPAT